MFSRDRCVVFLAMPQVFLQFVIVVFPDHTHLLFLASLLAVLFVMFCCIFVTCGVLGQVLDFIDS